VSRALLEAVERQDIEAAYQLFEEVEQVSEIIVKHLDHLIADYPQS